MTTTCFHPAGLAKRQLFKQVWACANAGSAGTEAHLAAVRSFHRSAWACFEARRVDPPQQKIEFVYTINQGGIRTTQPAKKTAQASQSVPTVDHRTKKAILALERDCEFSWQELHRAIDNWQDGSRAKIRAIDQLAAWRKDYHKRWDAWLARGKKKLPAGLTRLAEFAEIQGQVHFVAGAEQYFATAKEAQRYMQTLESSTKAADAGAWYHSEINHRLMSLFDRAQDNPELWVELERAFKQVETEERTRHEGEDQSNDECHG